MYEYLEALFGKNEDGTPKALTFAELQTALAGAKDISIVNLKDGGYVSKEKFDAKETELNGVKTQLSDANKTIESYKGMDIEKIKQSVTDWENKYNTDTQALNDKLAAQARTYAENLFLGGYKFTSKAAKAGILSELQNKKFEIKDGVLVGAKDFMDGLQKDEEYKGAFVTETPEPEGKPEAKPRFSAGGGKNGDAGKDNPFNFGFTHIREKKD